MSICGPTSGRSRRRWTRCSASGYGGRRLRNFLSGSAARPSSCWFISRSTGFSLPALMPDPTPDIERTGGRFTWTKGKWNPLWALLIIPFLLLALPLQRAVRKEVNWKAAWATVALFEIVLMCAEYYSLQRGHWVYNEARLLGPKV